jgi:hypothetical protein
MTATTTTITTTATATKIHTHRRGNRETSGLSTGSHPTPPAVISSYAYPLCRMCATAPRSHRLQSRPVVDGDVNR